MCPHRLSSGQKVSTAKTDIILPPLRCSFPLDVLDNRSQRQGANSDLPGSPRPQRPLERLKVPVLEARACDSGVRACPVHVLAIIPETEVTPVLVRSWGQQERVG
ncbi:hypothetical protein BaRGS_00032290 [Batillaria attramentaria]|uniref:Uncharacterized protein n=1 Tax=Batillaria attramentaria TaxID=370345 RepID=A0ABD0JP45_9CAEN